MRRFVLTTLVLGSIHIAGLAFFASRTERTAEAQPQVQQASPPPIQLAQAPQGGSFQVGEKLFIEWHGSVWPATVLSIVDADRAVIHYDGYGPEWDEVVPTKRALRDGGSVAQLREGGSAFIEWKGSWWPATIRAVKKDGWAIRYDGYGPEWDETVGPSRIKVLR
ncbi:MAG: hypothetical protein JWM74_1460 [Myxococcaceae bacterium]|jgi:hypothetical protein|nr:hypothetical protein [Myxococcaceae bacterium]